jgi:hypothetical protein
LIVYDLAAPVLAFACIQKPNALVAGLGCALSPSDADKAPHPAVGRPAASRPARVVRPDLRMVAARAARGHLCVSERPVDDQRTAVVVRMDDV